MKLKILVIAFAFFAISFYNVFGQDYLKYKKENEELRTKGIESFEKKEYSKAYEYFYKILENLHLTTESQIPIGEKYKESDLLKLDDLDKVYYYIGKSCMNIAKAPPEKITPRELQAWSFRAIAAFEQQAKRGSGDIATISFCPQLYIEELEFSVNTCGGDKAHLLKLAPTLYEMFAPFNIYYGKNYDIIQLPGGKAVGDRTILIAVRDHTNKKELELKDWMEYKPRMCNIYPSIINIREEDITSRDIAEIEIIWKGIRIKDRDSGGKLIEDRLADFASYVKVNIHELNVVIDCKEVKKP